jgi:hypothetical protein
MSNPTSNDDGDGVMLFGSTHGVARETETGHMFEAVSFRNNGITLISTSQGAFPYDRRDNAIHREIRNDVLSRPVLREVTVRAPEVFAEDAQGEEVLIGTLNRYDGTAYDPTRTNIGSIEIVHRYRDSGSMVLTDQNPSRTVYEYQAHGATLLNRILDTQNPDTGSPAERKERLDNAILQLKAVWGDSVTVDLETGSFDPVGDGPNAQKCAYFKERLRAALGNGREPNETAGGSSSGIDEKSLPGL